MDWFVWVLTIVIALVTFTVPYVSGHTQFYRVETLGVVSGRDRMVLCGHCRAAW